MAYQNIDKILPGAYEQGGYSFGVPVAFGHNSGSRAAINSSATATAAQVATGYLTSTSAAATTITLPTGTLLGTALAAEQGTVLKFYVDNSAGASLVTVAVGTNGALSWAAANGTSAQAFGLLTVGSGATGIGEFTVMFSSATNYTLSRTG